MRLGRELQAGRWQGIELKSKRGSEHMPFTKMSIKMLVSGCECLLSLKWEKFYRLSRLPVGREIPLTGYDEPFHLFL